MRPVSLAQLVELVVSHASERELAEARLAFERETGAFSVGDACYEERIEAFFVWMAVEWRAGHASKRFAAESPALPPEHSRLLAALASSMRSLWEVRESGVGGRIRVRCLLGHAEFAVQPDPHAALRWTVGDVFDGRVVGTPGGIQVAPGAIFHPREAHEALKSLLAEARARGRCDASLLDPLLKIRMRFDAFTSIAARHVYRFDALSCSDVLAAPWHGPPRPPPTA